MTENLVGCVEEELKCANEAALSLSNELQEAQEEIIGLRFELLLTKELLYKRNGELELLRIDNLYLKNLRNEK